MFLDVLFGVLPLFFVMLIGFGASHAPKFPAAAEPALNVFVFYVALPALLYKVVARADISDGVPFAFLWISIVSTLAFALLSWAGFRYLLRADRPRALAGMLTTSFGNVSYLGIPIILGVMGPQAGFAAGMGQLVHNVIFMVGFPILAQLLLPRGATGQQHQASGRRIARTVRNALLCSPVTWAMVLGGMVVAFAIPMPRPFEDTIDLLSAAAAPGALFVIGMSLKRTLDRSRAARRERAATGAATAVRGAKTALSAMVAGKLVALPLLTVAMFWAFAPQLDRIWFNAAVLMAAMPVSATAYIMAQNDTGDGEPTAVAIVITCVLSVIALPLLAELVLK